MTQDLQKVLIVTSYKWKHWAFPKGKVEHDESGPECAIRELLEEIGYDCTGKINPNDYIEMDNQIKERLYLISGVDENPINYKTRTVWEIDQILFIDIEGFK